MLYQLTKNTLLNLQTFNRITINNRIGSIIKTNIFNISISFAYF